MSALKYKRATGILRWWLNRTDMIAIVMPNGVCYHTRELTTPEKRHEEKHWQQYNDKADQFGSHTISRAWFVVRYLLWNLVKGYRHNPFEKEAREAE